MINKFCSLDTDGKIYQNILYLATDSVCSVNQVLCLVRFQILTAASMKITVFWDVAVCRLVETD
jgi:hypothetical protein